MRKPTPGIISSFALIIISILLLLSCSGQKEEAVEEDLSKKAEEAHQELFKGDGEKMERDFWAAMKNQDWQEVESKIAEGFQSMHQDGPRTRAQEIELIRNLNLGEYTLGNFKVTQNGPAIVVSYTVSVTETIEGETLPTEPAGRISVWLRGDEEWQWISHVNMNPMKK